jgi:RNA polymerase sigma factor (sigma-70 family)
MRAVAAHQPEAEAALVRLVIAQVRARARLLTRDFADADDAAQTALVEILRSAPSFRGEGSLAGWCERITVRTTLRQQRNQTRKRASIDAAIDPDDVSEGCPEPELAEAIPGGAVEFYLAELSQDRHEALVLRHVLGHSVDEIAAHTGVSPNTVKDRLRMARKQVRQAIRQREVVGAIKRGLT